MSPTVGRSRTHSPIPARLDLAQSLTGLALALFMWTHLILVSSILLGKDAMLFVTHVMEARFLSGGEHGYPIIVTLTGIVISALFIAHAGIALRKFPSSWAQHRELRNQMGILKHADTKHWYTQAVTGFVMFFLGSVHLYIMTTQPDNIGPYASADRFISDVDVAAVYFLLLFAVELHATIGMYRLAVKWGIFDGARTPVATRKRLKVAQECSDRLFHYPGPGCRLSAYAKIGLDHRDRAGERYTPAVHVSKSPAIPRGAPMKIVYTDSLVIGGGPRRSSRSPSRPRQARPRYHYSLADPGQALALGSGPGRACRPASRRPSRATATTRTCTSVPTPSRAATGDAIRQVARMFANTAPKAIRELSTWGVPWSRVHKGDRQVVVNAERVTITEDDAAHGLITARDFGGTKKWRTCYTADGTGHTMLYAVDNKAIESGHRGSRAQGGHRADPRRRTVCLGAVVRDLITRRAHRLRGPGHHHRHGRLRPPLRGVDQRGDQRGHRCGDRARNRRRPRRATWKRCSFTPPPSCRWES